MNGVATTTYGYAGFWKRTAATLIDGFIIGFGVSILLGIPFILGFVNGVWLKEEYEYTTQDITFLIMFYIFYAIVELVVPWLYYSLFEKSKYHATPGKMAVGIIVVDRYFQPVRFGRATGRYWAKNLSYMILCIGYMMAGWTQYKQALHDMIASTYVVNKKDWEQYMYMQQQQQAASWNQPEMSPYLQKDQQEWK
ncbi:RDD family protein [Paenibacillus kyungheensis]|uniref:RDD family protein n=1 Tax=Paenibacillus kyungheensis TaxID=1452732 RepID=A0AAX3LXE4_9BACL|nr:RDD family protein [Paenibacillus kyungheensis]WCT54151.1 RDD family protein [Paenibacillus kyungheensis]